MIKYSFVIPTYNCRLLLKNLLHSLNAQTNYQPGSYEVVIVDDGSNDGTQQCVLEMAERIKFNFKLNYIYLERTAESCRARTRNTGWRAAQGEFVIFLDADMIVKNDYLHQLERYFLKNPNLVIVGTRLMLDKPVSEEHVISGKFFADYRFDRNAFTTCETRHFLFNKISYNAAAFKNTWLIVYTCNLAMAKKHLYTIDGFDENFKGWGLEDIELGYKSAQKGLQIVINPYIEAFHQFHGAVFGAVPSVERFVNRKKNLDVFYKKHPEVKKKMSKLKYIRYIYRDIDKLLTKKTGTQEEYTIEFKELTEVEKVKETILQLSSRKNLHIIVRDYLEKADLDLWIQLLGPTGAVISYYPMSRVFDDHSLRSFINSHYREKRRAVMVNLGAAFCQWLWKTFKDQWNACGLKNNQ